MTGRLETLFQKACDAVIESKQLNVATANSAISRPIRGYAHVSVFGSIESYVRELNMYIIDRFNEKRIPFMDASDAFAILALGRFFNDRLLYPTIDFERELKGLSNQEEVRLKKKEHAERQWRTRYKNALALVRNTDPLSINRGTFPDNGTYFKFSQLTLWFELFAFERGSDFFKFKDHYEAFRLGRNQIAHGEQTPTEVGRSLSVDELADRLDGAISFIELINKSVTHAVKRDDFFTRNSA